MVEKDAVAKEFRKQVVGYGLTTAHVMVCWDGSRAAARAVAERPS